MKIFNFKPIISTFLLFAVASVMQVYAQGIEIIGANLNNGALKRGIYSFNTSSNSNFTLLFPDVEVNGGGVYANGKYYALSYDYDANQKLTKSQWLRFDPEVWILESVVDCPLNDFTYIAFDRTWDSSTGKTYALSSDRTGSSSELSVTDLATGKNTLIGKIESQKSMICIASDGKGKLYTLDTTGKLYTINPTTAVVTLIGDTKIMPDYVSDFSQSMTYDPASGRLIWGEFHAEGMTFSPKSALYSIDPKTAATVKLYDLPAKSEFVGIFIPEQGIAGAPAAPSGMKTVAETAGALKVRVEFKAATMSNSGSALPETPITYEVIIDGETVDLIEGVTPGKNIVSDYYTLSAGLHTIKVRGENGAGVGKSAAARFFAGWDVPAAPTNVVMNVNGSNVALSWAPVSVGANGGAIRGTVTYNVKRMPVGDVVGNALTATSFSETIATPGYYWYEITPSSQDGAGTAVISGGKGVGVFSTPYTEDFSSPLSAKLFSVYDFNGDGRTWDYYQQDTNLRYAYSVSNPAEDMVVTPAISMSSAKGYELSFTLAKYLAKYDERVEVWFGNSSDPANMTKVGTVSGEIETDPKTFSFTVAPTADGAHYFGFKAVSPANQMFIYLDNISVKESGSADVPASVSDLSVVAIGDDRRNISVSFSVPTLTLGGKALSAVSKVEIFRDGDATPIKSFDSPKVGNILKYTDNGVTLGTHRYDVIVSNSNGNSQPASATVFAGIDTPLPATGVTMQYANGKVELRWVAPKEGVKGGSLEGILSYEVVRMVNMAETERFQVGGGEITFTDEFTPNGQAYLYYGVIAKTSAGAATAAYSAGETVGVPYEAPYVESFAGGVPTTNPWFISPISGRKPGWGIVKQGSNMDPTPKAVDGDNGMAEFDGYHLGSEVSRLITPRLRLDNLENPTLSFSFFRYVGNTWSGETGPEYVKEKMQLEIALDGGEWVEIPNTLYTLYGKKTGWETITVKLDNYTKCGYANIAFKGISGGTVNMYVDKICLDGTRVSSVAGVADSSLSVVAVGGSIAWHGLNDGNALVVYSADGALVFSSVEESGMVSLLPGLYIVNGKKYLVK